MRQFVAWVMGAALIASLLALSSPTKAQAIPTAADGVALNTAAKPRNVAGPVAKSSPNPGLVRTPDGWVMVTTGRPLRKGRVQIADKLTGPWRSTGKPMLTTIPKWMDGNAAVWAPSIIRASDSSHYVLYFAGLVKGHNHSRCIGAATSKTATGNFVPLSAPLACWKGSKLGAQDEITRGSGGAITLIDPTPTVIDGDMVLLYKTSQITKASAPKQRRSEQRMLRLDPRHPEKALAQPNKTKGSKVLVSVTANKIEENPVLVKHGNQYVLFTSWGIFSGCDYVTRYRTASSLWNAQWSAPTVVSIPKNAKRGAVTCGSGNAQIVTTTVKGKQVWRMVFNGHVTTKRSGPGGLYVGALEWSKGTPRVVKLLP